MPRWINASCKGTVSRFEPNCSRRCRRPIDSLPSLYVCFLIFQLCTHKDEFDDNDDVIREQQTPARPNALCRSLRDHHGESSNVGRRGGIKQRSSSEKILPVTVTRTRPTPKKLAASDEGQPDEEMVSLFLQLPMMHDDVYVAVAAIATCPCWYEQSNTRSAVVLSSSQSALPSIGETP